jgi:hypothetical protein
MIIVNLRTCSFHKHSKMTECGQKSLKARAATLTRSRGPPLLLGYRRSLSCRNEQCIEHQKKSNDPPHTDPTQQNVRDCRPEQGDYTENSAPLLLTQSCLTRQRDLQASEADFTHSSATNYLCRKCPIFSRL